MSGLIDRILSGELTAEEAEDVFNRDLALYIERGEKYNIAEMLGIDQYEATAYAGGASLAEIVLVRKNGWPDHCDICDKPIDYKKFYWLYNPNVPGAFQIRHIECLPDIPDFEDEPSHPQIRTNRK